MRIVGREQDARKIEKRMREQGNILLIVGMGGIGKTALLHHLQELWQKEQRVSQAFYFSYREQAWSRQELLTAITSGLSCEQNSPVLRSQVVQRLREKRHLLILDHLEAITGAHQGNMCARSLHRFLKELAGGETLILLASREVEEWLGTFEVYELPRLDEQAAWALALQVLERHGVSKYRQDEDLARLLDLLGGYPLGIEVMLAELASHSPAEVLAALPEKTLIPLFDRGEILVRSIAQAYRGPALGMCLAPFTDFVPLNCLQKYSAWLCEYTAEVDATPEPWQALLVELARSVLLVPSDMLLPHANAQAYLSIQPILTYVLRLHLAQRSSFGKEVEEAFLKVYDEWSERLRDLLLSEKEAERAQGHELLSFERENLREAVKRGLDAGTVAVLPYQVLCYYYEQRGEYEQGQILAKDVHERLMSKEEWRIWGKALDDLASSRLLCGDVGAAQKYYREALEVFREHDPFNSGKAAYNLGKVASQLEDWEEAHRWYEQAGLLFEAAHSREWQGEVYYQLGVVMTSKLDWEQAERYYKLARPFATRQRLAAIDYQLGVVMASRRAWPEAERYYRQSLAIAQEDQNMLAQAWAWYGLGRITQEQECWAEAEQYYKEALSVCVASNSWHMQASIAYELAEVERRQELWKEAEQYYQEALQMMIRLDERRWRSATLCRLGMVSEVLGRMEEAKEYYMQGLQMCREDGDPYRVLDVVESLARVWRETQEEKLIALAALVFKMEKERVLVWFREKCGQQRRVQEGE